MPVEKYAQFCHIAASDGQHQHFIRFGHSYVKTPLGPKGYTNFPFGPDLAFSVVKLARHGLRYRAHR